MLLMLLKIVRIDHHKPSRLGMLLLNLFELIIMSDKQPTVCLFVYIGLVLKWTMH